MQIFVTSNGTRSPLFHAQNIGDANRAACRKDCLEAMHFLLFCFVEKRVQFACGRCDRNAWTALVWIPNCGKNTKGINFKVSHSVLTAVFTFEQSCVKQLWNRAPQKENTWTRGHTFTRNLVNIRFSQNT